MCFLDLLRANSDNYHAQNFCIEKQENLSRPFTISDQCSCQILLCQVDIIYFKNRNPFLGNYQNISHVVAQHGLGKQIHFHIF